MHSGLVAISSDKNSNKFFFKIFLFLNLFKYQDFRNEQIEKKKSKATSPELFYTKQTVQNACGTVALIHALANNKKALNIDSI